MFSAHVSPFLDLATNKLGDAARDAIMLEFDPKLEAVADEFEFDLLLWSLAQRLHVDTEELLRQIGGTWLRQSPVYRELSQEVEGVKPLRALKTLLEGLSDLKEAPLPGMNGFSVELVSSSDVQLRVSCEGARRCCSFLEGAARALCELYGESVRYIRQPKRATLVTITFSCVGS